MKINFDVISKYSNKVQILDRVSKLIQIMQINFTNRYKYQGFILMKKKLIKSYRLKKCIFLFNPTFKLLELKKINQAF